MTEGTRTEADDSAATTATAPEPPRSHGQRQSAVEKLRAAEALIAARRKDALLTYAKVVRAGGDISGFASGEFEQVLADAGIPREQLHNDIAVVQQVKALSDELQVIEANDVARTAALETALVPWRTAVNAFQCQPSPEAEQACRRLHVAVAEGHRQIEKATQICGDLRRRIEGLKAQAPMIFPADVVVIKLDAVA